MVVCLAPAHRVYSTNSSVSKADTRVILNESQLINDIAKKTGESVVSVNVTGEQQQQSFFGYFNQEVRGAGTGIIISASGYIITNRHVVPAGSNAVSVTLSDGTEFNDVEVVGRTSENDSLDIAFLKIKDLKGKKLTAAKLGDSSKVQVGDMVIAIGNALGEFQNTVTSGIISGFGRNIIAGDQVSSESLQNLIQTDAAINQGNSGGPLVNINGEVIGINTAIAGGAQNIGFAIPIGDLESIIKGVLANGKLERPYLGVRYATITEDYANEYNLPAKKGAYILPALNGVEPILRDSPAAKAGLKAKDIITKIDDVELDDKQTLSSVISRKTVGSTVTLTVLRDEKEQKIQATLEARPEN